jgi:hypothetical protein
MPVGAVCHEEYDVSSFGAEKSATSATNQTLPFEDGCQRQRHLRPTGNDAHEEPKVL